MINTANNVINANNVSNLFWCSIPSASRPWLRLSYLDFSQPQSSGDTAEHNTGSIGLHVTELESRRSESASLTSYLYIVIFFLTLLAYYGCIH